jgi:hypothetical protein
VEDIEKALDALATKEYIHHFNEFFSIQNKKENVYRRIQGNEMTSTLLPVAQENALLIGKFPFVRAVMASGSLSKGYMDADSDLDFFIVTEPGRLWIARMFLVLYKKIFLKNSHKHFCINYFVSSDRLEIEEKNIFTATELATVLPLFNQSIYGDLLKHNDWITRFFPNFIPRPYSRKKERHSSRKKLLERMINAAGGNLLDKFCMWLTYNRWVRKYRAQYADHDFKIAFKTKRHVSKNHPKHYQKQITEVLEQRWKEYSQHYNLDVI